MTSRRFAPLFWCQFCSALNDNFLKNALVMLILFGLGGSGAVGGGYGPILVTLAGIVFIAPFFILSALGGELADRYDKAFVAARIKLAEIPIAGLAAIGFYLHSVPILFVTLALFGIIAALFGPVKYGILPEKLQTSELPAGNALVEGRDIPGDPDRHHRRRHCRRRGQEPGNRGRRDTRAGGGILGVRAHHSRRRAGRARPCHHAQPVDIDVCPAARDQRRPAPMGWRAHRFLVLGRRFGCAVAAAGHGQGSHRRHRGGGDAGPHHLRHRHRYRLRTGGTGEPRQTQPDAGTAWARCSWAFSRLRSAGWPR